MILKCWRFYNVPGGLVNLNFWGKQLSMFILAFLYMKGI